MRSGLQVIAVIALALVASASVIENSRKQIPSGYKFDLTRVVRRPSKSPKAVPGHVLNSDVPVANVAEYSYMVNISISGQSLPVILDTGSSDLWVVSTSCTSLDCLSVPRYNPNASPSVSFSQPPRSFQLTYLLGAVEGKVATETVTFGPYEVTKQVFALAETAFALHLGDNGNSGILGLAFPSEAAIPTTVGTSLLTNILSAFLGSHDRSAFFAFKLGRNRSVARCFSGCKSSFTVGTLDEDVVGRDGLDGKAFVYSNVSSAGTYDNAGYDFWKLPLHSITVNSLPLPLSRSLVRDAPDQIPLAVLDTGTTLILGPAKDVTVFWEAVGGARWNDQRGLWEVRCERGVLVGFVLGDGPDGGKGGKEYVLHPSDISWKEDGEVDGWCIGGVQANDKVNSGDWLLGDAFLRNVYVTHHISTPISGPLIGLLNLTDPASAMSEFRLERGPDVQSPAVHIRSVADSRSKRRVSLPAIALSSTGGFFIGGLITIIVMLWRRRRTRWKNIS